MENEPCLQQRKRSRTKHEPGPDGVEAWCVALAACFISFVMAGLARMAAILYVAFIDIYKVDRKMASLPISIRSSIRNLLGPLVGILGQKYGVRPVTIVGAILGALSAALCFYVEDIIWMTVVWGGLNGIGTALTNTLPQVTIGQHFKKYRSTAAGMAFSGGCIGSFLIPALLQFLLHTYTLGGTFLILSGVLMHVIPAAMVLRKPTWLKTKQPHIVISSMNDENDQVVNTVAQHIQKDQTENKADVHNENELSFFVNSSKIHTDNKISGNSNEIPLNDTSLETQLLWENRNLLIRLLTDDFTLQCPSSAEVNQNKSVTNDTLIQEIEDLFYKIATDVRNDKILEKHSDNVSVKTNGRFEDKCAHLTNKTYINENSESQMIEFDVICSNPLNSLYFYLENLFERDKSIIIQSFSEDEHKNVFEILESLEKIYVVLKDNKKNMYLCTRSTTSLFLDGNSINFDDSNSINFDDNVEHPNTFISHIKTAFKLFTKPLFILICLCRSVHFLTFMPAVTIIVDFSMDKGLHAEDGIYVIAALSFGDFMGRLCLGWITDKGYVTLQRYMLFTMIIQGASTAALSFMDSKATLMSAIAIFGLLEGSIFVRQPVLVSRYLGSHEQSIAMGCINFFSGIVGLAMPFYIGYFRDITGSYNGLFYINGAMGAFVGFLWVFEPYFFKQSVLRARRNRQEQV